MNAVEPVDGLEVRGRQGYAERADRGVDAGA
jgi:hypothetical protein